jgi:hypothetical protein
MRFFKKFFTPPLSTLKTTPYSREKPVIVIPAQAGI